jgi:4-hydroxy-2-oxoheptanedioate aldolase
VPRRTFTDLLALDRPALGTWSQIPSPELIDILGGQGFDFTIVDCEHGAFGLSEAENLLRACDANGLAPLLRAPRLDPTFIGQVLDAGAEAVIVPGIETPEQARAAVAATRFAPEGTRGACPCVRAGGHFITDWRGHVVDEQRKGIIALVETSAGVDAIEAIAAVPGLLALLPGPFDLSVSMGLGGDWRAPEVEAAIDRMAAAARSNGLPLMAAIFDPDPGSARALRDCWQARGARLFVLGTDKILFASAVGSYRAALADRS